MVIYRKATYADLEFLYELRTLSMKQHVENAGYEFIYDLQIKRVLHQFEHAYILELKNIDIGLFKINKESSPWNTVQIQILPEYQGKSLGKIILNKAISDANAASENIT